MKKEMGKEARRNQSAQIRKVKRDEVLTKKRALGGEKTPPFAVSKMLMCDLPMKCRYIF